MSANARGLLSGEIKAGSLAPAIADIVSTSSGTVKRRDQVSLLLSLAVSDRVALRSFSSSIAL